MTLFRFVVEDLERTFEEELLLANIQISHYPAVITSEEEALAIAEANGAELVLWGRYSDESARINTQVGYLDDFDTLHFETQLFRGNHQCQCSRYGLLKRKASRCKSWWVFHVSSFANGDMFDTIVTVMLLDQLGQVNQPDIIGTGVASLWHAMAYVFISDTDAGLELMDRALDLNPSNALLYAQRSIINLRAGNRGTSSDDLSSAQVFGPDEWITPLGFMAIEAMLLNSEPETALPIINEALQLRPVDWYFMDIKDICRIHVGRL